MLTSQQVMNPAYVCLSVVVRRCPGDANRTVLASSTSPELRRVASTPVSLSPTLLQCARVKKRGHRRPGLRVGGGVEVAASVKLEAEQSNDEVDTASADVGIHSPQYAPHVLPSSDAELRHRPSRALVLPCFAMTLACPCASPTPHVSTALCAPARRLTPTRTSQNHRAALHSALVLKPSSADLLPPHTSIALAVTVRSPSATALLH